MIIGFFYNLIMGNGSLSVFPVYGPLNDGAGFAGKRSVNCTGLWSDVPTDDCQIFPMDLSAIDHGGQNIATDQMLGNDRKSGGVAIQSVAAAEDKCLSLCLIVPGKCIGQRVGVIVQGRMDGHPRRFIDDDNIFVFVYNIQWNLYRRNLFRAGSFPDAYLQPVTGMEDLAHIIMLSIDKNTFGHPFDFCQVLPGISASS